MAHSFLPPNGEYPIFDLILAQYKKKDSRFLDAEKRIGYIGIWTLHGYITGLIKGFLVSITRTELLVSDEQFSLLTKQVIEYIHEQNTQKAQIFNYPFTKEGTKELMDQIRVLDLDEVLCKN